MSSPGCRGELRGTTMDKGTVVGLLMGFGCIGGAISMHGSLKDFVDVPGAIVAFGGSTAGLFVMFPAKKVFGVFGVIKQCFLRKLPEPRTEIKRISQLATIARRDGQLA